MVPLSKVDFASLRASKGVFLVTKLDTHEAKVLNSICVHSSTRVDEGKKRATLLAIVAEPCIVAEKVECLSCCVSSKRAGGRMRNKIE